MWQTLTRAMQSVDALMIMMIVIGTKKVEINKALGFIQQGKNESGLKKENGKSFLENYKLWEANNKAKD